MANPSTQRNNPPVETIRLGGISAAIFANDVKGSELPLYKVSLSRTYVNDKKEFKTVTSFRQSDLPYLLHVSHQAWARIEELRKDQWDDSRKESDSANDDEADDDHE